MYPGRPASINGPRIEYGTPFRPFPGGRAMVMVCIPLEKRGRFVLTAFRPDFLGYN